MNPEQVLIGVHKLIRKWEADGQSYNNENTGPGLWGMFKLVDPNRNIHDWSILCFARASGASFGAFNRWGRAHSSDQVLRALDKAIVLASKEGKK